MSSNEELAQRLAQMGRMLELLGEDSFKANAHARAARTIDALTTDVAALAKDRAKLLALEGIGTKMADKIVEFCTTGRITEEVELRAKAPPGLMQILGVPGLGPKTVRAMWTVLGITDMAGLKKAIADGSLLTLPRMGEKAIEKIKVNLALAEEGEKRQWLGRAWMLAEMLVARLGKHKAVAKVCPAGSLRRGRETVGDIDILVALKPGHEEEDGAVSELFRASPGVTQVLAAGETKSSVRMAVDPNLGRWGGDPTDLPAEGAEVSGPTVQVDLRVVPRDSWGTALLYFTGSKEHNVRVRERAQERGLTLNEWGLFEEEAWRGYHEGGEGSKRGARGKMPAAIAGKEEEEVFQALDLPFIPPEIREDRGELDLKKTPRLIELEDVKAELHAHTTASDGALSIEELAREAHRRGFHTIAVTDHSQSSTIANGLKPDRLRTHIEAVRRVHEQLHKELGIAVLCGSEVDILADGTLDYKDDLLEQLDVVVASPHAALSQDSATATKRLLKAVSHPKVHILGHPTGRLINRRRGLEPDMREIIAAAREHGVALEINAHWMRLDLRDTHVRAAVEAGCVIAINCDVHHPDDYDNLRFGVMTGRRGWLTADLCVNAWEAKQLHAWLKKKRR